MLLGLSSPLRHSSPEEWAADMERIGAPAINFPLDFQADPELIRAYQEAAERHGLVIAEVGVWRNTLASDPAAREKWIEYAIGQLRLAEELGARCCVNVLGTPYGPRWDGGYRGNFSAEIYEEAVKMIRRIIDEVKPKNTCYTIESMPWMIPTGPSEYRKLVEDVDREAFGVHLDMVNMITSPKRYFFSDEFMRECFETLAGRIVSCHLKDIRLREEYTFQLVETACGKGTLNLKLYTDLADKERPDMPMIIEHLGSDEEYLETLAYMKELTKA